LRPFLAPRSEFSRNIPVSAEYPDQLGNLAPSVKRIDRRAARSLIFDTPAHEPSDSRKTIACCIAAASVCADDFVARSLPVCGTRGPWHEATCTSKNTLLLFSTGNGEGTPMAKIPPISDEIRNRERAATIGGALGIAV
jgi:hypothetical protein